VPPETPAPAPETPPAHPDLAAVRQAIELYRKGDLAGGDKLKAAMSDAGARALVEWTAIRAGVPVGFDRIAEFLHEHPGWPAGALLRRRGEEALLAAKRPAPIVRAFFAAQRPTSPAGKLALALALRSEGLEADAAALIRDAWREDSFNGEFEARLLETFPGVITEAEHRHRMERFLFKESWANAARAAERAGKEYASLVRARQAVIRKAGNAAALLEAVPERLRSDTSYLFSKASYLRRSNKTAEAAKIHIAVTRDASVLVDGDEWWTERRIVARKLLDEGNPKLAYEVARQHGAEGPADWIEAEFHAGWIALRFLDDAETAARHFAKAATVAETPISVSRAAYWQGRAAEALGDTAGARAHFARAAELPIAYYGQLARVKLGQENLPLRVLVDASHEEQRKVFAESGPARALKLIYTLGARDLALAFFSDFGNRSTDPAELQALGDLAVAHKDARGLLLLGKLAVQRGFPLDLHAYPVFGIPSFEPVGTRVEKAMVYAIARQESAFDPRALSHAGARGLMQLMPATARRTAQRFNIAFELDKLLDDPAYNARIGMAHLGELMDDWKGSLILTFASYNAGGGNVSKWIKAYGDPRSPEVDPVDWIERIPFSETRNYVQRVLENFQVYRQRLGERTALLTEADLRRSAALP
jgi:soluble lytic murein transglycosylase